MVNKTYKINPNIIWKDADDTIYILQPEREEIHALNETGSFIWRLISKGYFLAQVEEKLLSHFTVTPNRASIDIQEFVDQYVKEKFLIPKGKKIKKG